MGGGWHPAGRTAGNAPHRKRINEHMHMLSTSIDWSDFCNSNKNINNVIDRSVILWNLSGKKSAVSMDQELKGHTEAVDQLTWDPTHSGACAWAQLAIQCDARAPGRPAGLDVGGQVCADMGREERQVRRERADEGRKPEHQLVSKRQHHCRRQQGRPGRPTSDPAGVRGATNRLRLQPRRPFLTRAFSCAGHFH